MNNGWIKLHRKILDNGILNDQSAWCIFSWLLLKVDRETGKKTIGRFWASEELGLKPTTFYQAVRRLEKKWKVLTQVSNNRFTEISLINWQKYQSNDNSNDNRMTTDRQQNDTLQEYKNIRIKNTIESITEETIKTISKDYQVPIEFVLSKIDDIKNYCASTGKVYKDYVATLRHWVKKDALNIRKEANRHESKRGIDARNIE